MMILRRIAQHMKQQHWTGVFIELVIVVLGVFIGLQVSNWNSARKQRQAEIELVRELRSNLASEIKLKSAWIEQREQSTHDLEDGIAVIQAPDSPRSLMPDQCTALWRSGIYLFRTSENPTLIALLSPTRLDLIRDPKLQTALLSYYSLHERAIALSKRLTDKMDSVVNKYPDAFPRRLNRKLRYPSTDVTCNLKAIRASRALKNMLLSNLGRANGILETTSRDLSQLKHLKAEVDAYRP